MLILTKVRARVTNNETQSIYIGTQRTNNCITIHITHNFDSAQATIKFLFLINFVQVDDSDELCKSLIVR